MTLVNARAAFEKAVTDAVAAADNTVLMVYDNMAFTTPGKTKKYILMTVNFGQSTLQNQGAAQAYYAGTIQCNVYVPKSTGTAELFAISQSVIDGLTSVNEPGHASLFFRRFNTQDGKELLTQAGDNLGGMTGVIPRVLDIVGPTPLNIEDRSHFVGIISCQFTATT